MVIRIRLSRSGPRNHPLFNLVAIQSPKRRDAKPLEQLGIYSPQPILRVKQPSLIELVHNIHLAKHFKDPKALDRINHGAQPTPSALRLLRAGGIVNQLRDLKLLRSKTSKVGTKPRIPLRVAIATTRRGPRGILSRFRRRGLLPLGTRVLPNGKLRIPPSVTKTGKALMLDTSNWTERLEKGASIVDKTPHRILPPRWKAPPRKANQTTPAKPKQDPAWWKVNRRRRAAALALTDQLPKPRYSSKNVSKS
ncbi:hypothetical protein Pst134EA_029170 [Puccinia striiformis f. sp. tritici]|uniref:hypothetical protein n=1 Tax=Puccinia striiformis f. sp. tritici TaxID=168172 RepID=UPI002007E605|nr:hypothetical protein Pst134EA_029135 [Puccinia striiformis f. sp. tritici]XP_047798220.1 hypothetical protein Pst134EA_029170 [Puccinia striiformis f. sp. tritici]KAH9447124.1 hypothetical protein Pst134EA_029135 [Puccinia striiformis f. sp. tritici]KAH9447130.1 hypothetical protein Pst134EA_029170 [Puccinia striiformis f. sp. tritici]KAI9623275.1 hypothetical protein H4Q26_014776 [Puccinia striiformis f. sp. tritici PST-130]